MRWRATTHGAEARLPASNDGGIADLDLVERSDDARLGVRDGAPAVVYPREALQGFNLLRMGPLVGRDIAEKVLNLLIGLRRA